LQARDDRGQVGGTPAGLVLALGQVDGPPLVSHGRQLAAIPPSFVPRAFAAARAFLVRSLIKPTSSSATASICRSINFPAGPSLVVSLPVAGRRHS
jgi:hypothetical protein